MTAINVATRVPSFRLPAFSSIPQAFERIISSVFGRVHCSCEKRVAVSKGLERRGRLFNCLKKYSYTSHHIHLNCFAYVMRPLDKGYRGMVLLFLCLCLIVATVVPNTCFFLDRAEWSRGQISNIFLPQACLLPLPCLWGLGRGYGGILCIYH